MANQTADAFGQMLLRCLSGDEPVFEIIERDDGFIDAGDARRYFSEEIPTLDRWAVERCSGHVLDIGAGAGRIGLVLQAQGCDVVALDISPGALAVCSARGVRETFAGDICDFASAERNSCDTALLLGNNLGLLGGPETAPAFLDALDRAVAPGGLVLATGRDAYRTDDPVHVSYHAFNLARGRWGSQLRIRVRFRQWTGEWFDYLLPSIEELEGLLQGSAWRLADALFDDESYVVEFRRKR